MKLTKLKIVQMVLSAIDSDDVSSISDTVESEQVAVLVDTIYDDLNGEFPWPHLRTEGVLEVTTTAHVMRLPQSVLTINNIYYRKEPVTYLEPEEMTTLLFERDTTLTNVDSNGAYNDRDPRYWTSYNDTDIVFDSYNGSLVEALTYTDVYRTPTPMLNDNDYPDMPDRFHNIIFQGACADAMYSLKGDVTGFNIWRNRYKQNKAMMDRWAKRVNRQSSTGKNVDFGRKAR
jgi:hypothetical protein